MLLSGLLIILATRNDFINVRIHHDFDISQNLVIKSYENTSVWQFTHFQFVIVAFAISCISHYRLPFYTNAYFSWYALIIFTCLTYIILIPNSSHAILPGRNEYATYIDFLFNTQANIPFSFRIGQYALILFHLSLSVIWEVKVVNELIPKYLDVNLKYFMLDWRRDRAAGVRNTAELEAQLLIKKTVRNDGGI